MIERRSSQQLRRRAQYGQELKLRGRCIMFSIRKVVLDGAILSPIASLLLVVSLRLNPRIWLQDYPEDIQNKVLPKTEQEKRLSLVFGIPFLVLLAAVPFISTLALKRQGGGDVSFLARM